MYSNILHPQINVSSNRPPIIEYIIRLPYTHDRSWPSKLNTHYVGGSKRRPVLLPQSHSQPCSTQTTSARLAYWQFLSWFVSIESSPSLYSWNVYSINPVDRAAEHARIFLNSASHTEDSTTASAHGRPATMDGLPSGEWPWSDR